MQNWNDLIRTQLDNLASFPAKQTWQLGEWIGECRVRPGVANFAALPMVDNEIGDVRVSTADQAWYIWDGAAWQSMGGGGGGGVNNVTASAPIASSGGANPNISLTGVVDAAHGGTGIAASGALGNVLTSNGAGGWVSSAPATTSPAAPLTSVQFNNGGAFGGSASLTWNGSTLAVDGAVDRATAGTLTVGGATATAITVGQVGVTTTFPGPVNLIGDVTTVGGTQFTTDATFDGNVTFGNAASDNISFVGQVDTAITQEGIAAPAVSPASTGRIYFDSGSNKFRVSQNGGAYVDLITGGTVTGSGVATRVAFWNGASALSSDANLYWDDTNNRLGVGTSTPGVDLDVGDGTGTRYIRAYGANPTIYTASASTTGEAEVSSNNDASSAIEMIMLGTANATVGGPRVAGEAYLGTNTGILNIGSLRATNPSIGFFTGTGPAVTNEVERARITNTEFVVNDPGNAYNFRVASDTNANMLFVDGTNNRVGVGTATPANVVDVVAGTLAVGQSALKTTGTLSAPSSDSYEIANYFITTPQGATDGYVSSFYASLGTGYTGVGRTTGGVFDNIAEGTGTAAFTPMSGALKANFGGFNNVATTTGTTPTGAGVRVGALGYSGGSSTLNVGVEGLSLGNAGEAVGVYGGAIRSSGSNNIVGGYFSLYTDAAPFSAALVNIDAALVADNGPQAASILVARDNGTATFTIADSGYVTSKNTSDSTTAFQVQNAAASTVLDVDTSNSRVGVLTTAPVAALDLASGQLAIPDGSAAAPAVAFRDDLDTGIYSSTNGTLNITSNGSETARFYTSAGSAILQMDTSILLGNVNVADDTLQTAVVMVAHADQNLPMEGSAGGQFLGVRTRGTGAAPTAVGSGDGLWNALGAGYTSAAGYNYGALISFKAEQAYTATASGGRIEFHTTLNGTDGVATLGGAATERMRIANDGKVFIAGVATTNTHTFNISTNGTDPAFAIASGGRIHYYDGSQPTNGQVLIGDTASGNFAKATITAGTGISVTNGAGSITIAATGAAASTSTDVTGYLAQEALNAGDLVRFVDDAGTPKVQKADATNTDARLNPVGFAVAAASAGAAVTVRVAGVADVPASQFDSAPAAADVGKRVFVSTTSGQITLTAPSASGDILQRVGVLVDGSGSPKVLVQIGDPTLL